LFDYISFFNEERGIKRDRKLEKRRKNRWRRFTSI